jgi:hypothetical protein
MEWVQFIIFFIGVFGLFIWNRTESRADIRHMDNKLDAQRALLQAIWQDSKDSHEKWMKISHDAEEKWFRESKDFHGRLCEIEERYRKS